MNISVRIFFYIRIATDTIPYLSYFDQLCRVNFSRLITSIFVSALTEITKIATVRYYLYNYLVSRNVVCGTTVKQQYVQ